MDAEADVRGGARQTPRRRSAGLVRAAASLREAFLREQAFLRDEAFLREQAFLRGASSRAEPGSAIRARENPGRVSPSSVSLPSLLGVRPTRLGGVVRSFAGRIRRRVEGGRVHPRRDAPPTPARHLPIDDPEHQGRSKQSQLRSPRDQPFARLDESLARMVAESVPSRERRDGREPRSDEGPEPRVHAAGWDREGRERASKVPEASRSGAPKNAERQSGRERCLRVRERGAGRDRGNLPSQ